MKKTNIIKTILIIFACVLGFSTLLAPTTFAADDSICGNDKIPKEVRSASGCDENTGTIDKAAINIINAVIGILSIVAVIFIIMGGVQYMTSSGDPGKVKKAKDTILYACIGLAICVLAYAIVNFVINHI